MAKIKQQSNFCQKYFPKVVSAALLVCVLQLLSTTSCDAVPASKTAKGNLQAVQMKKESIRQSEKTRLHGATKASDDFCMNKDYMDDTLTLIKDAKLVSMFADVQGLTRFEGSSITRASNNSRELVVVFDEYTTVARLQPGLDHFGVDNVLLAPSSPDVVNLDSQFEGVILNPVTGTHYVVRESVDIAGAFFPSIWEIRLESNGKYEIVRECLVDFQVEDDNAGFEGLEVVPLADDNGSDPAGVLLLGLCETNNCKGGDAGANKGNGMIIASRLELNPQDGTCTWKPVKEINIPSKANFADYSDLAFVPNGNQLSVISQEESSLFVAEFDQRLLEFVADTGKVYNFPRNVRCEVQYCNVEGIVWLDNTRFAVASDKAKDSEPFFCLAGDQSVSVFSLPP